MCSNTPMKIHLSRWVCVDVDSNLQRLRQEALSAATAGAEVVVVGPPTLVPSAIASSGSNTAGSCSYSTLINLSAFSAVLSSTAATAATRSPTFRRTCGKTCSVAGIVGGEGFAKVRMEFFDSGGYYLDAVGLQRFFETLATMGQAIFVDNRVLFAHQGLWPSAADRFHSDLRQPAQIGDPFVRAYAERTGLPPYTRHTIASSERLLEAVHQVSADGYALDNEEAEEGVGCIGTLIRDSTGAVVAGLSISAPIERRQDAWIPLVQQAGRRISERLGYFGH